jgi:hypothetical protein
MDYLVNLQMDRRLLKKQPFELLVTLAPSSIQDRFSLGNRFVYHSLRPAASFFFLFKWYNSCFITRRPMREHSYKDSQLVRTRCEYVLVA